MNTNSVEFFKNLGRINLPANSGLFIAVWNITNPANMGHIIRLAHNVGAKKLWFVSNEISVRQAKIKKTAGFSFNQMNWEIISEQAFLQLSKKEFTLVALETCDNSQNIFQTTLPQKTIILAGNESHGIPEAILRQCQMTVFIPMPGACKSMNVSHALSVASFEWLRQVGAGN